jgi:hypothetical protein
MTGAVLRSVAARLIIAGLCLLAAMPASSDRVSAASSALPTFGNPTISGIQGYGFEQDLRLDTQGRIYTSVPGGIGSLSISYAWRSLDGGQTFKWLPAATQPFGKLPMCNVGGDTELATDSADRLYINDLGLANYGTARSSDFGRTLAASPCASVLTAPDDRPWYAVDGDPLNGGSITLAYNVAPNVTPVAIGHCEITGNQLVFARSPLPDASTTAGLEFGAPQFVTSACSEGIMGNDEVFTYGSVKRAFTMHNNDALNQIRMARCDIVPFTTSLTGYANCVDNLIFGDPATVNGGDFPTLTIDRAGNLFAVWEQASCGPCPNTIGGDTVLDYSVSTNQGDSWSTPRTLPTGLHTNVFAWPAAGDSGRVDVAWYGTPALPTSPFNGPCSVNGDWSLYMTQSVDFTDTAPSWTPPILASEHFIHRGSVQTLMGGQMGDRTLGDFLQIRIGRQGEANISYADSNSETEALASQGMFVRQNGGSSVFANAPVVQGPAVRINSVSVGRHAATLDSSGISSSSQPNLEILGSQVSMPNTSRYRIKILVADLTSLEAKVDAGGKTLIWNTQWKVPSTSDPHGGAYFHAYMESVPGSAPTFWVGQNAVEVANGSVNFTYPGSTQLTTGVSYTATAPGVINIDVPVRDVTEQGAINNQLYSVTTASMSLTGNAETPPNIFSSGIGGNLFNLVDLAPAYDFNPSQPTPPFSTCHEADGDGQVQGEHGGTASFQFDGDACEDGSTESVDESDAGSGTNFHSTNFSAVTFDDLVHSVTIVGDGTDNGNPVTFTLNAVDNGVVPGLFSLILSDGYSVSGTLLNGSIQLR